MTALWNRLFSVFSGKEAQLSIPSRLILVRHAEAKAADFNGEDESRELSAVGMAQAKDLGQWLDENLSVSVDLALVSPASRAIQTYLGISAVCRQCPKAWTVEQALYKDSVESYQTVTENSQSNCLIIVGHNPMIGQLAVNLLQPPVEQASEYLNVVPGACFVIDRNEQDGSHSLIKTSN